MRVSAGQVPIRRFRQRLRRGLFVGWLLSVVAVTLALALRQQRVVMVLVALAIGCASFALLAWDWRNPASCPDCDAEAKYAEGAMMQWRHRFPYGYATTCHGCGADLAAPYDGTHRPKPLSHAAALRTRAD